MPVIARTPETSESATNRFSPSVARPLGWANAAAASGAVVDVLAPDPGPDADRARRRGRASRSGAGRPWRCRGPCRRGSGSGPRGCSERGRLRRARRAGPRIRGRLVAGAGDRRHRARPSGRRRGSRGSRCRRRRASRRSRHIPCGRLNVALSKSPSSKPSSPLPIATGFLPSRSVRTIRLWPVSAMNSRLPARRPAPCPGRAGAVSSGFSHLGEELRRGLVQLALGLVLRRACR